MVQAKTDLKRSPLDLLFVALASCLLVSLLMSICAGTGA